tara:strand:+ start:10567 stop:11394 length:828 start_codon:yes stop_codon:yes gene_type:complete
MKKFIDLIIKFNLLFVIIFIKRFLFSIKRLSSLIRKAFSWFLFSKEHTNFSFELDRNNLESLKLFLLNNLNIKENEINLLFEELNNIKIDKSNYNNTFSSSFSDVDFKNKWDYRLLPYIAFISSDVNSLFEFGYDQGRLPFLLQNYIINNPSFNKKYIGIDINPRKGALISGSQNFENIILLNKPLEEYLLSVDLTIMNNSVIVSSTHEKNSEDFLFQTFKENNITPKIIVSDEVAEYSAYKLFVKDRNYKNNILIFNDKNEFLSPLYIGISIRN